jgi:Dolichol phosphate-mannose biosynthesis regulatory protein (DPM2)
MFFPQPQSFQIALAFFVAFFVYILVWTVLVPLFDSSNPIHGYFYPQKYFFTAVAMFFVIAVTILISFISCVFIWDDSKLSEDSNEKKEKKLN